MRRMTFRLTGRVSVITAVTAAVLALAYVPSSAEDNLARVTVTDQAGAPGQLLQQLERATGRSLGTLQTVMAVDTAGRELTVDQLEALMSGRAVEGVRVLGSMAGSRDVLGTTMADLADGRFDGTAGEVAPTTALLFANDIPQGREWCLTMCISGGRTVMECILARLGTGAGPVPR